MDVVKANFNFIGGFKDLHSASSALGQVKDRAYQRAVKRVSGEPVMCCIS